MLVHAFGGLEVLSVARTSVPAPGRGEVRVRPLAVSLNPKDVMVRKGRFSWAVKRFPYVPGFDFCGEITALGTGVPGFRVGDRVMGMLGGMTGGALAVQFIVQARRLVPAPDDLDPAAMAGIPLAGLTALQALRRIGRVRPGRSVCINGAAGGVGTLAVQIARDLGGLVTTLSSAANLDRCRDLGAHCTLDYTDPDALLDREFDVFFDVFGNRNLRQVRRALTSDGIYVSTIPKLANFRDHLLTLPSLGRRARVVIVQHRDADLAWLARRLRDGRIRPVLDRVYDFSRIHDAFAYLETRHAQGKVVIRMPGAAGPRTST